MKARTKPQSPCHNCSERTIGCHTHCAGYDEYKTEVDSYKKKQFDFKQNTYFGPRKTWNREERKQIYYNYKNK